MNEEDVIKNVVELLKGINNSAAEMVCSGDLKNAVKMYETGEQTSLKFYYADGAYLSRLYIVKIHIMEERYDLAMSGLDKLETYDMSEKSKRELDTFYKEAGLILLKVGMDMEKAGDLKGALHIFEKIRPHLNKKRAEVIEKEIELLKSKVGADKADSNSSRSNSTGSNSSDSGLSRSNSSRSNSSGSNSLNPPSNQTAHQVSKQSSNQI